MPTFHFGLMRMLAASGLFALAIFSSALAQEPPIDPNYQDVDIPAKTAGELEDVTQLVPAENDYQQCAPAPGAWHPPIYYPTPETCCPTGNVCRDWLREHTVPFAMKRRQRMLEKDYAWRAQNGWQPVCCPPHSNWGHKCDECEGSCWSCFGSTCDESSGEDCVLHQNYETLSEESPAIEYQSSGIQLAAYEPALEQPAGIQLVSDQQPAAPRSAVETAGCCTVSDSCTTGSCAAGRCGNGHCLDGRCLNGRGCRWCFRNGHGWGWWRCHYCPLRHRWCYDDECDECDDGHCCCLLCCWKKCLFCDCGGGWRREIPPFCHYGMSYPVNPYHFDQRDGRIYAAQGYGHPVGVPLAPNVEHAYNYGWGIPSSRLTPISRMPGAPGVANPAVPGAVGPGIFPPGFPAPITGGPVE